MYRWFVLILVPVIVDATSVEAGTVSKVAREAAEYVVSKFGREAAEEGTEVLAKKIDDLVRVYGDDALQAVRKVGPRAFPAVREAGEHAPQALRLMARHGDSAIWVVSKPGRMAIFIKYGDEAAEAMIKHGQIAETAILKLGKPGAEALQVLSRQNGRRLVMMLEDGTLAKIGRTDELLDVIRKYGDAAMEFIWKNKGALTVTAALIAFLSNPEAFINGTLKLAEVVGHTTVEPMITHVASRINWTLLLIVAMLLGGGIWGLRAIRGKPKHSG